MAWTVWPKYQAKEPPATVATPAPVRIEEAHDEYSCELDVDEEDVRYRLSIY
jgi:hypothetical protein